MCIYAGPDSLEGGKVPWEVAEMERWPKGLPLQLEEALLPLSLGHSFAGTP